MKKHRLSLILLGILFITSVIGLFSVEGFAQSDLNFTFERNILIDEDDPIHDKSTNLRNQTLFTDTFNATYSFTNDIDGNNPIGFNVIEGGAETVQVISDLGGHDKVLELFDTTNGVGDWALVQNEFTPRDNGTTEMWVRFAGATDNRYFYGYNDITKTIGTFFWVTSGVNFYDANSNVLFAYSMNTWYHVKVWFDCDLDIYSLWVNGFQYVNEDAIPTGFEVSGIGMFQFNTKETDSGNNYWYYIDALNYDWDGIHNISDNIIPYNYKNATQEVDKWEFFNNEDGSFTTNGQGDIPYWSEINSAGYITKNDDRALDETSVYFPLATATHEGLEKIIDVASAKIKQVDYRIIMGGNDATETLYEYFDIDSFDDTLICRLRIDDIASSADLILSYYDGVSYIPLKDVLDSWFIATLDITIVSNMVRLNTVWNSTIGGANSTNTYYFPVIDINKDGLGDVKVEAFLSGVRPAQTGLFIDSIGVYVNNNSLSDDYGSFFYASNNDYNRDIQNLLFLNATGNFSLGVTSFEVGATTYGFFSMQNASEFSIINTIGAGGATLSNAYVVLSTDNLSFTLNSISIEGIKLFDGSITYYPSYSNNGTEWDDSYFYVDTSNRLRGHCFYNDSYLEYIQINFDINNVLNENRSIRFKSQFSGQYGFFSLSYLDSTSSTIDLPISSTSHNIILPQEKTIDEFIFLITDDNNLEAGYGSGYISDIELIWNPSISITIVTISLIMVVIPLIIMIVPTLTIYSKYGKSVIMPVFILMCIICFAGGLIPAWLFFILMIGSGGFLVLRKGSDV